MQRRSDERKSDLRNVSVLEMIIAIIIVLVILLHGNNLKFGDDIDQLVKKINYLTDENIALQKKIAIFETSESDFQRKLLELREKIALYKDIMSEDNDATKIISTLKLENLKLSNANDNLKEKIAVLDDQLKGNVVTRDIFVTKWVHIKHYRLKLGGPCCR